jgi:hypothetical protein
LVPLLLQFTTDPSVAMKKRAAGAVLVRGDVA